MGFIKSFQFFYLARWMSSRSALGFLSIYICLGANQRCQVDILLRYPHNLSWFQQFYPGPPPDLLTTHNPVSKAGPSQPTRRRKLSFDCSLVTQDLVVKLRS